LRSSPRHEASRFCFLHRCVSPFSFDPIALRADSCARAHSRAPALVPDDDSASHVNNTARLEFSGELIVFNQEPYSSEQLGECLYPLASARMTDDFSIGFQRKYYLRLSIILRTGALNAVL
jgi:hypothetical protein